MSTTTISKTFKVDDVATNPDTSITIAVTRTDTSAVVVAAGTAMTQSATGVYYSTFTDPAYGLTYDYIIIIVHAGETYTFEGQQVGSSQPDAAITKAQVHRVILDRVRRFGFVLLDIDEELRSVLYDLSTRENFLETSGTITTVDGTQSYTQPSMLKEVKDMYVDTDNHFEQIPYAEFLRNIENTDAPHESEPYQYALWNGKVYFWPIPDAAYTVIVEYYKYHANSVATIEFAERFREAIYAGVLSLLWSGQLAHHERSTDQIIKWRGYYANEIVAHAPNVSPEAYVCKYNAL
jgi:hypothetical protein